MTDYTDLIARLRTENALYGDDINGYEPPPLQIAAADALEAQAKLIEKLEANAVFWQKDALHTLKVKNEGDARIAELKAALKPFADKATVYPDLPDNWLAHVTMKHLRAARAALEKTK